VYARNTTGAALGVEGNATQNRDKGGLVKAMLFVDPSNPADQYVVSCYNGLTNASTPATCGFSVTRDSDGRYKINFGPGFTVVDRFFSLTVESFAVTGSISHFLAGANEVRVNTWSLSAEGSADNRFYLVVY
jgi:hypothetical protein